MAGTRRRFLAPEVIQTSAMDCGPAALKCLLDGFGLHANYGRLREACHTSVDGSSIDTLEELAVQLGLEAAQVLVPVEHLLSPEADALPALVVVRQPSGLTHFVVLWRVVGPWVQVMDPGRGRRWMHRREVMRELYVHEAELPAEDVETWLAEPGFRDPLRKRLAALRVEGVFDAQASWQQVARADAVARAAERLIEGKAIRRRRVRDVASKLIASGDLPDSLWSARPGAEAGQVLVRGAVALKVWGRAQAVPEPPAPLAAVLAPGEPGAGRRLIQLLRQDGVLRFVPLLAGLVLAGLGSVVEALLLRGAMEVGQRLSLVGQRVGATAALVAIVTGLACIEWPLARGLWSAGRKLELQLRRAFLRKLPRLGDRYFQSRPISDLAERAHMTHWLRLLPEQAGQLVRTVCELAATTVGVIWLHPPSAPLVLTLAGLMVFVPILSQPILVERDLRMRGHSGSLARFYLDALLGLAAIRAHTAESALQSEHGERLREWARAARDATRATVLVDVFLSLLGFGLAAALVFRYLTSASGSGWAILLVYWLLMIPALGQEIALLIQQYPQHRNVTMRLLEPLGAPDAHMEVEASEAEPSSRASAPTIEMLGVRVVAAGHPILSVDRLAIPAGQHVAIVGSSGAGKSSLVGLLLGWYEPDGGAVRVDGKVLTGQVLRDLRAATVWVDPTVQLWNRSLLDNLRFGAGDQRGPVGQAVEAAQLDEVLARLPMGLQTPLGAGGGLLSGGEGQRVRLGRAFCRGAAQLVVLDEAFCGLERTRRQDLLRAARQRWSHATLLCITHDVSHTLDFSRVLVIESGRIIEDDAPQTLAQTDSRYARLLAAEKRALARLAGVEWRRLRVENGALHAGGEE
jgi:ATP-binding cassette subfamily B protein